MRRARISIKPNVRPGGRSVAPAAEDKSSQGSTAVGDTQQTLSPSPQSQLEVKESAVGTGDGNVPGSPSEKASLIINDGAPSSVSTPATTVLQRRSRFSATPNLGRPKVRSAPPPSSGKTVSLPSETSKTSSPFQAAKSFPQSPIPVAISRDDSQNSTFSDVTTAANYPPSSPCLPSTSGCPKSPLSTVSQQKPCQTPQKIPNEDFGPQGVTPVSCTLSPYVKLSRVDGPDSPLRTKISSDKQRVLRALKLKELMKLERKKEGMEKKSRQPKCEHGFEPDRDKMTLADFIYYLPESNPMKSSLSTEETQTQTTAPPTPTVQKNMAEVGEEDDDDADEELLVPKVKVAEDGSLILDEESLTVRVQRMSDTVVENANPLFERGSTTTYTSFRKKCYVKNWSVRETDMFYLAISMVGTDFSMITQLLTHRSRAEIKSKFKKEERANAWRVDKAFRNKRPYDSELFSFLLKRVLAKDKQKGKSIKLVVKSSKAKKGKDGKKVKPLEDKDSINDDDELCSVDSVCFDLEKENEDSSNMNEADVPSSTSKKRKRTKDTEPKTCKASKKNKTPKKAKCLMDAEDGDLVCVDNDLVEEDSVNADNEDQSCMPVSKKTRKHSKKGDQEGKELKIEEKQKKKKNKKTLEVRNEEPTDGESGAVNEEHNEASAVPSKKRKRSKKGEKGEKEPTKRERKTKKSKTSQEECTGSELGADGSEVSSAAPGAEEDQGEKHFPESAAEEEVSQSSFKRLKRPNLAKRKVKICSEPKATVELEDTVEKCQDESCREADNELRIICLAEDQLQNQPVVVLERTPPRLKDSHNSSEIQNQPQPSQSPQHSPGRQMRAEKVKRNLTASGDGSEVLTAGPDVKEDQGEKLIPESTTKEEISQSLFKCSPGQRTTAEKNKHNLTASEGDQIDQCHTGSDPSPEDMSSTAMANQVGMQDSKEADQCMEEGLNLQHLEFLTSSEVNGQTLLKRAVVLVSHDEVKHYLRSRAQTTAEESTASESQQDTAPARVLHVVEHRDGLEEQGSTSGTLEERASQEVKETDTTFISAQQSIVGKRRFSKPKPSLSRAAQSIRRPLNVQTTDFSENTPSFKCDSVQLQCSSPVEVQVKNTPNECLVEEHRDRPEEESTCSVTPEENGPQDVQVQDDEAETTVDDLPSLTSVGSPPRASKILPILGMPQVLDTTPSDEDVPERRREFDRSPSQTSENEDQITDQEEQDSEPVESEVTDAMIEESQTELKRIIPVSCSADGSSVYTQDDIAPERHSQFDKQTPNLEGTPPVMINPQQTLEPKEDSAEKPEAQSPVQARHSHLDHDIENISREDKLLSSEVDLQERKLDEPNDPVLSDASSAPFEAHSLVSPPNEHASNLCDMDTMQFSESVAEDIQIPGEQVSEKQDCTEEPSEASEECSAPLNQNAKSEISDSAGVDTDKQSEEEPTFILTLYEIPASQLFHEAAFGQQGTAPYELQPAQFQTASLLSSSSHFRSVTLEASSASLHMASEETSNPCKSSSHKLVDDSLDPLSKDAVDGARTQLISSQESSRDDVNSLISPPVMFSCNSAMPTDVPKLDEILTESPETKAPTQRRCKIKVKPKLKPGVKVGPSKNGQFDCAPSQYVPPSQATAQTEIESNQKTSAQETVGPKIHSSPEESERRAHPGPDAVISTALVPVSEDMRAESQVKWESPLRTELQTDEDTVVDPPVHSTFIKESEENTEAGYEGVSHLVLADAFVLSSGEMKDVFNKEQESPHDSELQKPEDISVCRTESEKSLSAVSDQKEKMADIAKKPETYREASCVTSSASQEKTVPFRRGKLQVKPKIPKTTSTKDDFSRQEQSDFGYNDPAPLIKEESIKVEQGSDQEDFSDIPKEELDREPAVIASSSQLQQLIPFSTAKTSACTELQPVELKIEDGHEDAAHVLSDILMPVSAELGDGDHMASGSSIQSSLHMREESQQAVAAEADQETHSHKGVSHMLLTDILIPVCEEMADDLSKEWTTTGKRSPLEAKRSQVREDPDTADLSCAVSQSSNVGPSVSPKRKRPTLAKGKLLVEMTFPKRKTGDSPKSDEQSQTVPPSTIMSESTQCRAETCAGLLPIGSEDCEEACGGVSHMVLSDILVPVLDETAECTLHKEAFSAGLKEDAVHVKKSTDIERPTNTETEVNISSQSVAVKWKTPGCRRGTLHPKPKLSKRKDDSSETDLCEPSSTQTHLTTSQQSLDPQAAEWSLKSNMLPMDSDEIENWCEGVSHMLLSDAFVPVSEEIGESSTDLKVCVSSIPHKDEQIALSLTKSEETPSEISSEVHQLDTTSDMPKTLKSNESPSASQAKNSPTRSTFQMTLRSPERRFKVQPCVLKSTQAPPTTPQRTQTSKVRQQTGEISSVCRIQLERLSVEEICSVLQPKHHSTPVTVKTTSRGNEMHEASLVLHGSRSSGLESHADEEPPVLPGYSPRVVLHRIPLTATDENTSTPTSSPARVSTTPSRTSADHQSPQNSPPVSDVDADKNPVQVSHFLLDDIFTEVVDSD
ncbi:transcription factor TFIIIB component B'' homolog [Sinocyclocheilus anshuiensis]|uniref:transcription factor TFIIIB component B'' homolog n=1 Tax=Sinocyclocheilus anshuiensis TaxID=1608454 RepID=UPI0007B8A0E3|nr:PREDICTED: transcription factor TFIIIB component B'' homolog [Sinocyclocheilus anshuiensis]